MQWLRVYINEEYANQINVETGDDDEEEEVGLLDDGSMAGSTDEREALLEQNEGHATKPSGWDVTRAAYRSPEGLVARRRRATTLVSTRFQLRPVSCSACIPQSIGPST